jgi:hypothetical protein
LLVQDLWDVVDYVEQLFPIDKKSLSIFWNSVVISCHGLKRQNVSGIKEIAIQSGDAATQEMR